MAGWRSGCWVCLGSQAPGDCSRPPRLDARPDQAQKGLDDRQQSPVTIGAPRGTAWSGAARWLHHAALDETGTGWVGPPGRASPCSCRLKRFSVSFLLRLIRASRRVRKLRDSRKVCRRSDEISGSTPWLPPLRPRSARPLAQQGRVLPRQHRADARPRDQAAPLDLVQRIRSVDPQLA